MDFSEGDIESPATGFQRWLFSVFGSPWLPRLKFAEPGEVCPVVDSFEEGDDVVV